MKKRNKIATIVLFLAAIAVGFDAQPGWSQFGYLDPGYTQCPINFGTSLVLVGMVSLPDGSLLVGAEGGGLWSVPPLPSNGTLCPTSPPRLLSNNHYAGMALGLDGKVYANKCCPNTALVTIDPSTGNETSIVLPSINGLALALDPLQGDLYVTTGGLGPEIRVITGLYPPNGPPTISHFTTVIGNENLDGLAWSCDGTMLLAAGIDDDNIIKVNRSGSSGILVTLPTGTHPDGIAFGAAGGPFDGFFFVNSNDRTVTKIQTASPHAQRIIASGGQRGDFVTVDRQGNLLLTQYGIPTGPDQIIRLSTTASGTPGTSGGQWVLPGSSLCGDLGCGAKAQTIIQFDHKPCLSGLNADLLLTLSQSACGTCENCATLNQARSTLLELLNSLDPPLSCLDSLKLTLGSLYRSCPCNPDPSACVPPCANPNDPNCYQNITKLSGGPCMANARFPFGIDLESYDPILQALMREVMSP